MLLRFHHMQKDLQLEINILQKSVKLSLKIKKNIKLQPIQAYRYNLLYNEDTRGLKVKVFEKADKEWLRFILKNRRCDGCVHDMGIF